MDPWSIEQTYHRLGGWPAFGDALIDESICGRDGRFQTFVNNKSIYWNAGVAGGVAHQIGGSIRDKWGESGWENGILGYPTTDEEVALDQAGRFNHFENGSIFWTPSIGAHFVAGDIHKAWVAQGWERGQLGYPTSDEKPLPDGVGRFSEFQGGSIYWKPGLGAHVVPMKIRDRWAQLGWETGRLGYPVADPVDEDGVLTQRFEHGVIHIHTPKGNVSNGSYTGQDIADYRLVVPLTGIGAIPWRDAKGTAQLFISNFAEILRNGDKAATVGAKYHIYPGDGTDRVLEVSEVADDGLVLKTAEGNPEGAGRTMAIRFTEAKADPTEKDLYLASLGPLLYNRSVDNWVRMEISVGGPANDVKAMGIFSDQQAGKEFVDNVIIPVQARMLGKLEFHWVGSE